MKTIILAISTLLFSASIFASEPLKLTNEVVTTTSKQVETTIMNHDSDVTNKRLLNTYDSLGNLTERINYQWSFPTGWLPKSKQVLTYNSSNELSTVVYLTWDVYKREWVNKKKEIAHYTILPDKSVSVVISKLKK